jgi:3-(3-hydroxy-phenyl)propionate hydroxylase
MADAVWRLDYQMDEHADPESISRPEVAGARLREQLGPDVEFEFVWIGPYQYRDHLLDTFRVGRTIFIGDAAHVVCPFGARGGNNGIQDAANLGWKLALVLRGEAGESLVDSYQHERHAAAVENLRITSRTARFLAPRSAAEHRMRRAVVDLARRHEFARRLANTGRMAQANAYPRPAVGEAGRAQRAEHRLRRHDADALPGPKGRALPGLGGRRRCRRADGARPARGAVPDRLPTSPKRRARWRRIWAPPAAR